MPVKGGVKCIKYLLFGFNFIFWLAGTAVLGIGLWLRFDSQTKSLFGNGEDTSFYTGVYILIGAGALMMLVGFLGCCGAIQESTCMLGLFFFFLLIIFGVEIAAGIWGFANKDTIIKQVKSIYSDTVDKYSAAKVASSSSAATLKETLTAIHIGLKCCGKDVITAAFVKETCSDDSVVGAIFTQNCNTAIDDVFNSKFHVIAGIGIGIGVVMIFGMIFSMILCCAIRNSREMV